jgi:hypothetical protein
MQTKAQAVSSSYKLNYSLLVNLGKGMFFKKIFWFEELIERGKSWVCIWPKQSARKMFQKT